MYYFIASMYTYISYVWYNVLSYYIYIDSVAVS